MLYISRIIAPKLARVFLATIVVKYEILHKLISDCDPHFISHFWCKLISILGYEHVLFTAYHLQIDRQTE